MSTKILILGGDGMLGHQLLQQLNSKYDVKVTLRKKENYYKKFKQFNNENSFFEIEASEILKLERIIIKWNPNYIINCIGIVKQRKEASEAIESIKINALLPHQLALLCEKYSSYLVQISTDCVFSGARGNYSETDTPDAEDIYGRTKLLGEVNIQKAITLRTSIIGLELSRKQGLVEWFLSQSGKIYGYSKAIFSGFTTIELANIIELLLTKHSSLSGVWHVASCPISKYQLLIELSNKLNLQDVSIEKDEKFVCDRSLNSTAFYKITGYSPPTWDSMLDSLTEQIANR